jgi:hypothetical protein
MPCLFKRVEVLPLQVDVGLSTDSLRLMVCLGRLDTLKSLWQQQYIASCVTFEDRLLWMPELLVGLQRIHDKKFKSTHWKCFYGLPEWGTSSTLP